MCPALLHTTQNLSSRINHNYFTSFFDLTDACDRDPNPTLCLVGAAALITGPFGREGRSEKEADRGHRPGPSVGRGPAERHPEGAAKGDGARSVSGEPTTPRGASVGAV